MVVAVREFWSMARKHLEAVARHAAEMRKAEADRDQAMVAAIESGETYRDVGKAAGLSHQRVWQIVAKTRGANPPSG